MEGVKADYHIHLCGVVRTSHGPSAQTGHERKAQQGEGLKVTGLDQPAARFGAW